jgi:hypothetical protein
MFHEHFLLGLDTKGLVSTRPEDKIGLHYMCFVKTLLREKIQMGSLCLKYHTLVHEWPLKGRVFWC